MLNEEELPSKRSITWRQSLIAAPQVAPLPIKVGTLKTSAAYKTERACRSKAWSDPAATLSRCCMPGG